MMTLVEAWNILQGLEDDLTYERVMEAKRVVGEMVAKTMQFNQVNRNEKQAINQVSFTLDRDMLRALLAGQILQGIIINPSSMIPAEQLGVVKKFDGVEHVIALADALLKRLEEEKP